jgi:RHS repeat-associated protein
MYYAYILRSERFPNQTYVGSTGDLPRRLAEHNAGKSTHTSKFKPWELVIYVAFQEQRTARVSGLQADYPLSVSVTYDSSDFSKPSFAAAPSGAAMTGGADGLPNGTTPSIATPLVTVYNYDPLGDLTSVAQGQQQRLFVYDGMGRLTTATTPESGTVQYAYTNFSQVQTRTDARGKTTTYAYDGINRLSGITYSDSTSPVTFTYDQGTNGIDRLTKMTDGVGSESYTYDILGRETGMTKTISGIAYPLAYSYNTANELKQITYPSGRTVAQTVDALGRLIQVTSSSTNYISGVNYNAAAQPTSYQYGNGVQAAFSYNAQMQLQSLSYSNTSGTIVGLTYGYGTGDNGQIQSVTDSADAGRTTNYTYDAWARLKTAQTTGDTAYPAWGLSFTYDRYGNRTAQSVTTGSAPANSLSFSTTGGALTNHADTFSYDASGNMLSDGTNTLTYDAENRTLTSAGTLGSATYTYDGNGLRVEKSGSNGSTLYIFSGSKVIGEYAPGAQPSSPTTEYIYAGANLVASITSGTSTYYHPDQLSARALTNSTGSVVGQQGNYPFGESWYASGTATKWKFTSYERDPESANDYAMARYDVNRLGRFNSPDPLAGSIADPQTLNRYAYARNDPANLIDPLGLDTICVTTTYSVTYTVLIDGSWVTHQDSYQNTQCYNDGSGGTGVVGLIGGLGSGTGGSGGAGTANPGLKQKICSAIPSGRTTGASGGVGGVGSPGGGGEVVVNYNSGQVSAFGFGGLQVGWNGGLSGSVYSGFVWGLNNSNSNYSGGFTGVNGGAGLGGFAASSSAGLTGGPSGLIPNPRGVTASGASLGGGLLGGFSGGATATNYTNPVQLGKFWAFSPLDWALYLARKGCQ